ncbi:MBL fold metallo-hydrolase [Candidatus Falkowbacteria bacterium]|nr:MBL fold metallo-hydrolase [Candidatus Falkowbacteria bacterium]
MQLTILGSGTLYPRTARSESGYLLAAGGQVFLLDSGAGTKRQIVRAGQDVFAIHHVFYTHTHVDHVHDLPGLLWTWAHASATQHLVNLFGPPQFAGFYEQLVRAFYPNISQKQNKISVTLQELRNANFAVGAVTVTTRLLTEKMGSTFCSDAVGYRFTCNGKSIVYCGDSSEESKDDVITLASGADVLLIDCGAAKSGQDHLTPELVGQIAAAAQVRLVIPTHFYPAVEKLPIKKIIRRYYSGKIVLAKDFLKIKI